MSVGIVHNQVFFQAEKERRNSDEKQIQFILVLRQKAITTGSWFRGSKGEHLAIK